jgi:hypothetical protein
VKGDVSALTAFTPHATDAFAGWALLQGWRFQLARSRLV